MCSCGLGVRGRELSRKNLLPIYDEPLLVAANKKTKGATTAMLAAAAVASSLAHTFGHGSGSMVAAATLVVVESWHWTRMLHPNPRSLEWISGGGSGSLPCLRCSRLRRGNWRQLHPPLMDLGEMPSPTCGNDSIIKRWFPFPHFSFYYLVGLGWH
jgi:hypothetical protein